jgi:hypothetical protein
MIEAACADSMAPPCGSRACFLFPDGKMSFTRIEVGSSFKVLVKPGAYTAAESFVSPEIPVGAICTFEALKILKKFAARNKNSTVERIKLRAERFSQRD